MGGGDGVGGGGGAHEEVELGGAAEAEGDVDDEAVGGQADEAVHEGVAHVGGLELCRPDLTSPSTWPPSPDPN